MPNICPSCLQTFVYDKNGFNRFTQTIIYQIYPFQCLNIKPQLPSLPIFHTLSVKNIIEIVHQHLQFMRCISSPAQQFPSLSPVDPYTAAVPLSPDHILSSLHLLGTTSRMLSPCSAGKSSSSQAAFNAQLLDRLHLHSFAVYVLYRLVKISQFGDDIPHSISTDNKVFCQVFEWACGLCLTLNQSAASPVLTAMLLNF